MIGEIQNAFGKVVDKGKAMFGMGGAPTPDGKRPEPDENRRALVNRWEKRIKKALEDNDKLFKQFEKRRKRVRGIRTDNAISNEDRTNLIYSTIAAILPVVYAKNPDISVSPSEAVSDKRYQGVKAFASTMESVLSRQFVRDAFLKKRAKACLRSAMATSIGWAKVMYQRDVRTDPIIQNRMNDVQDNIERLHMLIQKNEDPDRAGSAEADKAQLELTLKSLQAQVEKVVSEGLVIDHALSEDVIILDDTVRSFDGYAQASAIAQRVWFTAEKYETQFGYKPEGATTFTNTKGDKDGKHDVKLYAVFEIWSKDDNTVLTLCLGEKDFCREPYQPEKLGAHWYPLFPLGFNLVDGQFYPMSDVELLEKLADKYNQTNEQLDDHREDSIPVRIARAGGALTEADLDKIQKRKSREIVVVSGAGGKPLSDDIAEFQSVRLDPAMYDNNATRSDVDMMSGATDALRGSVARAKTATEAEYLQAGLAGRTGERQDSIADWIGDMAQYAAEILLQELTREQVKRIAGDDADWPQLKPSKDEALDLVQIEIRAGSMGRPNKTQEQEQWTKVLPLIQKGMEQVAAMRQSGQNDMADAIVELLRETIHRFDERIDLDRFIPPKQEGQGADPGALAAENQQLKTALQELQPKADQQQSAERVALIEAASSIAVELLKANNAQAPALPAIIDEIMKYAGMLKSAIDGTAPAAAAAPVAGQQAANLEAGAGRPAGMNETAQVH